MNKKKLLSTILVCCMLAGMIPTMFVCPALAASSFSDVDENSAYIKAVEVVNEFGIMVGDDQGNFNPNKAVTRAEMTAILCRMLEETNELTTSTIFHDVPETHWANPFISKALELGIVNGYGDGNFGPSDTVTYEQAIKMIVSSMGLAGLAEENGGYPDGYIFVADDYGYNNQVSAKKGELVNRWQVAIMIYNCKGME